MEKYQLRINCLYSSYFLLHIAYPLPDERVESARITAVAGRDAVLTPLISPGALIQQYFIDWQDTTSSATLAHIQGPRSQQQVVSNERYSIDPQTFELTISSVRFKDRGSYLGLIGVIDPKGQQFTYEHTQQKSITLDVYGEHFVLQCLNSQLHQCILSTPYQ